MAAAKAARRNTFVHELHLPNDPFQDPLIGRRTGVPLNIKARKDSHGFDNIDDYFPDSDPEEENVVPNAQSSDKDLLVGRKTGNNTPRNESEGFENVVDDCPESGSSKSKESSAPGEVESADTPEGNLEESPNDTGTAIKLPASREPTPQFRGQIKKRLAFTNGRSPNETEDDQVQTSRDSPSHKSTKPISEQAEESDTEIDIVAVSDDESQLVGQETSVRSPSAVKSTIKTKEKAKKQQVTHAGKTKNRINIVDEDDEAIDIDEIEEETFLTIGGNTTRMTKSPLNKSPVSTRVESFMMSESFVLEGTRHKSMSPEFVSSSDSQAEPEPKVNKSKIPVRQKGLPNTKPLQQRATRGRKKMVEEESQNVEPEVAQADEKADDEERGSPSSKPEQNKPTRRRKQQVEKVKTVELEAVEVQNSGTVKKGVRRAKGLPGSKQQQQQQEKSSRRARKRDGKTTSVTSDDEEEDEDDKVDTAATTHEEKKGKGRKSMPNTTQQLKKAPRGKKQKRDEENIEYEAVEQNNEENDVEKPASRKTRTKKGVAGGKKTEESENVEERSEKAHGGNPTEVSGRKTRAQKKKENDAKLDGKDAREKDIEGGGNEMEVAVDELEIENVESENMESMETGQETEESGKDAKVSRVQTKEKPGKVKKNNEANLEEVSRVKRKEKPGKVKENNELGNEATKLRKRGKGRKSQAKGEQKQVEEHQEESDTHDIVEELPEGQKVAVKDSTEGRTSSNETIDASVSKNSNVSSNASSSSESTKKAGNGVKPKRRKRPRVMPPYKYAASRRASKANSSKISVISTSHDSTTESELRADAKKPRLQEEANQTNTAETSPKKRTTTIPRKSGRAKRTGRTSEGETKSLAQGNETECSKDDPDLSGAAMQDADNSDDDNEINDVDSAAVDGVEDSFEATPHATSTMAQAQPVTALKSILKSGGSVARTSSVSRKRQITADKSHSGSSDADDESVLPAKQPNRKRLSTVSFASTPFVQVSPAVPANLSSTGLSFVSKDSSFRSTDGTFTPGSGGRTVRSSVGSASGSSAGESVIDPEEEVTITNDARQMEDTSDEQNTRRSKRTIIPPLQYWKNERIDYERRKSGGWCIKGVIKNATPTPKKRKKPKQNKKPVVRKENSVDDVESSEEDLDNQDLEDFQEITNPTGIVINPENDEQVDMDIFHAPGMLKFVNPSGKPAQDDDPLIVHKFISQPLFGGGQVVLRPGAEKGRQFVRNDTMVFYVTKGRVMVTVHQSSVVLHKGSTFFVPQGNSYNIKNLRNTDAKLMFVQIKG